MNIIKERKSQLQEKLNKLSNDHEKLIQAIRQIEIAMIETKSKIDECVKLEELIESEENENRSEICPAD